MRKLAFGGMFFLAAAGIAQAAEPLGEWRDEDGKATIKIVDCNSRLWGIVASESIPGGIDKNNPDKAKRNRPTLGMPVLINMKKSADEREKWEGQVYNAENGKTYEATIQLKSPNALRVEGCLVWPLCGGQTWSRVGDAPPAAAAVPGAKTAPASGSTAAPKTTAAPFPAPVGTPKTAAAPKGSTTAKAGPAEQATADLCMIPEIASAPVR